MPDAGTDPASDAKAKVYILLGQSNMVGFGQVSSSSNGTRVTELYVSDADGAEPGMELSIYAGAHDPSVDYETQDPIVTTTVRINDEGDDRWPSIDEPHTGFARGYFVAPETNEEVALDWGYGSSSYASVLLDGREVYRRDVGEPVSVQVPFETVQGQSYLLEVTYFTHASPGAWRKTIGLPGTLEALVKQEGQYPHLIDAQGNWVVRDDVWYTGVITATRDGKLTVDMGADQGLIGPELQFGHVMGDFHDEKVLLLKASQGNRSLGWDLLPPGSERFTVDGHTYAGYQDPDDAWPENEEPTPVDGWYAGKQYDEFVREIQTVLDECPTRYADFAPAGCEVAGFAFFQGHKDTLNAVHAARYEVNLANFIRAMRAEFGAVDEPTPFVVATIGFQPMQGDILAVAEAQLAVSGDRDTHPDFSGNVLTVDTRDFWRDREVSPMNQGFHYNRNAETFVLVGEALGQAMVELLTASDDVDGEATGER